MTRHVTPRTAVALVVVAELLGTSVWFSANAALDDLVRAWHIAPADVGALTSAVQTGFIAGTLVFALTGLADRYGASRIFAVCALVAAASNAAFALIAQGLAAGLACRFATGFALAGVYPLGMKLVVSWQPSRAGEALGWLIGMLTFGTALPHAVRAGGSDWDWRGVVGTSSVLAVIAAILVVRLGDGPHFRAAAGAPRAGWGDALRAFRVPAFRASAFGYFGHMWELYAFWTLTPFLIAAAFPQASATAVSAGAFTVIAAGGAGCILGGRASRRFGSARVAALALAVSGTLCLAYPLVAAASPALGMLVMIAWGVAVVADSPQFSALSAGACPSASIGSALALQNSIGFAITVVAIAVATTLFATLGTHVAWLLAPGPVLGLLGLRPLLARSG